MHLQIYKYREGDHLDNLTTIDKDGDVWFVANEVCKLLDIKNPRHAVSKLDDDEKNTVVLNDGIRGNPNKTVISESGFFALVFKSKKAGAKKFTKWVTKEVIPSIRRTGGYTIDRSETPNFMIRYNENSSNNEQGYFSVITETYLRVYSKIEKLGYIVPNKAFDGKEMRLDVSIGKLFAKHLRDKSATIGNVEGKYKTYLHKFPNGRRVEARQYDNSLLGEFVTFIDKEWIPKNAAAYFKVRDPIALKYLPKLLG